MVTEVDVGALTTYSVGDDGKSIVLRLTDVHNRLFALKFAVADLGMLAMTLPSLIESALSRQYSDKSFRYTHPMGDWSIEQSNDPSHLIVTMKTSDGFGVSFSLSLAKARQIGGALWRAVTAPPQTAFH